MAKAATVKKLSIEKFRAYGSARTHEPAGGELPQKLDEFFLLVGFKGRKQIGLHRFAKFRGSCHQRTPFFGKTQKLFALVVRVGCLPDEVPLRQILYDLADDVLIDIQYRRYGCLIERFGLKRSQVEDVVGAHVQPYRLKGGVERADDARGRDPQKIAKPIGTRDLGRGGHSLTPILGEPETYKRDAGIVP